MTDGVSLPSTFDQEAELLAALMMGEGGFDAVSAHLKPEHFSNPMFSRMFEAIGSMVDRGDPVNLVTVSRAMSADPAFADNFGPSFWIPLTGDSMTLMALGYADHIADVARRRMIRSTFATGAAAMDDLAADIDGTMHEVESALAGIAAPDLDQRTYTIGDAFRTAVDRIGKIARGEIPPGLKVHGLQDWDDITGGMRPGDYILIGARPSMGKTALSLSVARRAVMAGQGVLYISREMDIVQLMPRMLADMLFEAGGHATFADILNGRVDADDMRLLREIEAEVRDWPLDIVDPDPFNAGQLSPLIRRHRQSMARNGHELGLVIVDYLGLIDPPAGRPNREQEVTATSRALKAAARANRVPLIVLSQLSRAVEQREDKRPQLSDLRDSGSLEQDADMVIFIFREEYYLDRSEPDRSNAQKHDEWRTALQSARDRIEIYSAKNRQSDLCRRRGYFFGARQAVRNSDFYRTGGC